MKKFIVCIVSAAIVAQIWGMISWMLLPWHMADFKQFKNEDSVATVFLSELQDSGLYTLPNLDPEAHENESAMVEWERKAEKGPFAFISVRAQGVEPGMGKPMVVGFLLNLILAGILFWLDSQTRLTSTQSRAFFIGVAGSAGGLYSHMANWNWWHFPFYYSFVGFVDMFITWFLAGFVMASIAAWMDK